MLTLLGLGWLSFIVSVGLSDIAKAIRETKE